MIKSTLVLLAVVAGVQAHTQSLAKCTAEKLTDAMKACDSMVNISQLKCDDAKCHKALHVLVDPEYIQCYEDLKLGKKEDLTKYKELDDFCHGEGPDPLEKQGNTTVASGSKSSDTDATITTPKPASTTPVPTPSSGGSTVTTRGVFSALAIASVAVSLF